MTCRVGLCLPPGPDREDGGSFTAALDAALPQLAGHLDSLWMTDHFMRKSAPCYEAWTVLAWAAARWPQFNVAPIVLGQSYRNPALLAKMAATLQSLTGGRFIMGIGAGWKEDEYLAYDFPFPRAGIRIEQLQDTLEILTRMWREPGPVTWQGRHYRIREAICEPRPEPMPPIVVGAGGLRSIRLAAQYADGWNPAASTLAGFRERRAIFQRHCEELERDPAGIEISWFGCLCVAATERAARERASRHRNREGAFVGTPAQVLEQMQPFIDLGVSRFILEILDFDDEEVIGALVEDVLPALR